MGHCTILLELPASLVVFQNRIRLLTCFYTSCRYVPSALESDYVLMTGKLFLASFLSAIVYSLIFLMLRGTLVLNGGLKIHLGPERRLRPRNGTFEEYQRFVYSVARTMLW